MDPEKTPSFESADAAAESVRGQLLSLYEDLDREIADLGPACQLSGRCCRFAEYGHTLFISEPEFVILLDGAPAPSRPLDDGETCPWQDHKGRCTARGARPIGCRVYFCDPRHEPIAPELSERYLARLKRLAEQHDLPWNYAPLHRHTHRAVEEGTLVFEKPMPESRPISPIPMTGPAPQDSPD